jgi:Tol biopolymer transport system component
MFANRLFHLLMIITLVVITACTPAAPGATLSPVAALLPAATTPPLIPTATARPMPTATPAPIPMGTISGHILFISNRDGRYDIYVMNGDGSGLVNLTKDLPSRNQDSFGFPHWSPDGKKIAFGCDDSYICVINADGSGFKPLTDPNDRAANHAPSWSPDGSKIAYSSNLARDDNGNEEIYVMNADGTGQIQLTDNPANDSFPDWSPNGKEIVFCSARDGQTDIYVMNADGSGVSRVTNIGLGSVYAGNCFPHWSPDGTKIAFNSAFEGNSSGYIINIDGTGLTHLAIPGGGSAWSPDGKQILFGGDDGDLYVVNVDGSGLIRLTDDPPDEFWPDWHS